ncbi:MAG TPA: signal peptidase II [Planctomycetia bacterium]|nr:signal peptidase II [Planctomycetia bacterium]
MSCCGWLGAKSTRLFFGVALFAVVADLATKWAAFSWVRAQPDERVVVWPGRFELVERLNLHGIWSIGFGLASMNTVLLVVCSLVVAGLVWYVPRRLPAGERFHAILFGLILGGAIGNIFDRAAFGGVRDFIQVYLWNGYAYPTFNVADSFLVCSLIAMFLFPPRLVDPAPAGGTGPVPAST